MEASFECGGGGDDPHYVFDSLVTGSSLLASLSDMSLQHYDLGSGTLQNRIVAAHRDRINSIELSIVNPGFALSSSSDKSVALWDLRTPSSHAVSTIQLPEEVLSASLGAGDVLVAAACDKSVQFFDLRKVGSQSHKHQRIGEYADAHTDLVTQVKFHPSNPTQLISAAEDGLICVFDTAVAAEEEAVISVLNTECPVRRFGFFGAGLEGIYSLSTIETASFWHAGSAQRVGSFPDIRQELGADYLVDCLYCPVADQLLLLAGNYSGRGLIARVDPSSVGLWATMQSSGHSATIRCCALLSSGGNNGLSNFLSGAEDGRIVSWTLSDQVESHTSRASEGGTGKHGKVSASLRSSPY